jgi:lysozyme family protein
MSTFDLAIPTILRQEGKFVNHPNDPGGATNYGISLSFLRKLEDGDKDGYLDGDLDKDGDVDVDDIKLMTREIAISIYKKQWWDHYEYEKIVGQSLATKIFSLTVNTGGSQGHKLLQQAINDCSDRAITVDGVLGRITLAAANYLDDEKLLDKLKLRAVRFYTSLVLAKKTREAFLPGWNNRALE